MISILAVPLFNSSFLPTVMSDVIPLFLFAVLLPTRGAGLIAVRPTECTKGGVEEQAGCRMKCEGCCVGWRNNNVVFFFLFIAAGIMNIQKHMVVFSCLAHEVKVLPKEFYLFIYFGSPAGI
ncbi:hypothetical protein Tc00.1047053507085.120 [Trypanosoma cruzi]|uniref:Uncharacterized protein n=1 Tax=Trypanosoma cruzi (strain CL Brener) TaxID=353153 RepID=Q4DQ73_TRYCC|nr:hypothetical protein Tc00.1047053507085.120 [Trypanosoma cruzi]EAN94675.1 hypothetical protein Tc00.1047053507085.120 [Trypanosoma cruzi]|eukprot:XP_816526.1 hypothetical protein [Trypanosoma cruzi strain CL Brener]